MYELKAFSVTDKYGNLYFDTSFRDGERVVEKRVEPKKLAEILLGSVKDEVKFLPVPTNLPECVKIARMATDGCQDSFEVVMVFPEKKRGFSYMGNPLFIPFPALVMKVSFVRGIKREGCIWALDTDEPNGDSVVYHYPFGNVGGSGSICFGNIKLKVDTIADAPRVFEEFILGATNNELYRHQNTKGLEQGELIKIIETSDEYPKELLLATGLKFGNL